MNSQTQAVLRAACIFIAAASILAIGVQPIFIGLVTERLALSLTQQSAVMSAEMSASILGTLLCMPLMRRCGVRNVALVAGLMLLASTLLTARMEVLPALLGLRFISGIGSGLLYAYAVYSLGGLRDPDRSYGVLLFLQTALFAGTSAVLPMIAGRFGFTWAIEFMAGWFALVCVACLWLPRQRIARVAKQSSALGGITLAGLLSLLGMVLLQLSIYSLWGFVEGIGAEAGLSLEAIGQALSIGLLGGLPGAALPSLLGHCLGRVPMILAGSALVLLSILLFASRIHSVADLALAVFLMNVGWNLALSYYMSSVVTHDPSGRLTRMIGSVQVISAAAAPTLLMVLLGEGGRGSIFVLSSVAVVTGCGAMMGMVVLQARRTGMGHSATR